MVINLLFFDGDEDHKDEGRRGNIKKFKL